MAALKRRAARAGYIRSDDVGLVHVPDLYVPDHEGEFGVGFLHDRFRKTEDAQPEALPLPQPNPDWRAPQKFERRR